MLYNNQIQNYEDFKSRFGYKTGKDGNYLINKNGIRQRKNNIVYQYFKESFFYYRKLGYSFLDSWEHATKLNFNKEVYDNLIKQITKYAYSYEDNSGEYSVDNSLPNFGIYLVLNHGICLDGDISSVRYKNLSTGKIYKMKIGKYFAKFLESIKENLFWYDNPILKTFIIEEVSEKWKNNRLLERSMKVVIDSDFEKIYSRSYRTPENTDFRSCMDDHQNWHYYSNHSELYKAISLQDNNGNVYARSILIKCLDSSDKEHTLLERIYCNKRVYKDVLFEKAKVENAFDLYKELDASCQASTFISKVSDDTRFKDMLHINMKFKNHDYMSYQDTFKYYFPSLEKIYNSETCLDKFPDLTMVDLATTDLFYKKVYEEN